MPQKVFFIPLKDLSLSQQLQNTSRNFAPISKFSN
jgi:hypothetical protein